MFRIKFLLVFLIDYTSSYSYTFIQGPFTFQEGHARCESMGMSLAIITDNAMQTEVENFLTSASGGETRFWIGMVWNKPNRYFEWVDHEKIGPWTNWDPGEPNCMEGTQSEPLYCPASYDQNCVRIEYKSKKWVWKTHGCYNKYPILCHSLSLSTTTFLTTDAQTTTMLSTPDTTVMETASSTEIPSPNSPTYLVYQSAGTTLSSKTNPTTTTEPTEPRIITTTKQETSFKPSTSYIPVECTMLGTFFINSTQVCSCQLLSNRSNLPEESWNFKIDKRSTNGYIRRHTSAYDGRLSSKIMGYTGIIIIGGVVLFVLFADLTTFLDKQKSNLPN